MPVQSLNYPIFATMPSAFGDGAHFSRVGIKRFTHQGSIFNRHLTGGKLGGCFGQSLGWAPFFFGGADLIVLDLLSIRWLKKIFSPNGSINGDTMGESNNHL